MEGQEKQEKKSWFNQHLATVILGFFTLISTTLGLFLTFNQHSKDALTDFKIEQMRLFNEEKINTNNRHVAIIYSEMYDLLHKLDIDRVFIIQAHPKTNHHYLSVFFEVDKNGISMIKDIFQNIPISEMPTMTKSLGTNNWLYYNDIYEQVNDARTLSLMRTMGTTHVSIRQLTDASGEWIGSLVAENTQGRIIDEKSAFEQMKNMANTIQFILPPIN